MQPVPAGDARNQSSPEPDEFEVGSVPKYGISPVRRGSLHAQQNIFAGASSPKAVREEDSDDDEKDKPQVSLLDAASNPDLDQDFEFDEYSELLNEPDSTTKVRVSSPATGQEAASGVLAPPNVPLPARPPTPHPFVGQLARENAAVQHAGQAALPPAPRLDVAPSAMANVPK